MNQIQSAIVYKKIKTHFHLMRTYDHVLEVLDPVLIVAGLLPGVGADAGPDVRSSLTGTKSM